MISEETKEVMRVIDGGCDIYGYGDAKLLRELQQSHPEYVNITKAMMYEGDGTDQMPYFGAILTEAGRAVL